MQGPFLRDCPGCGKNACSKSLCRVRSPAERVVFSPAELLLWPLTLRVCTFFIGKDYDLMWQNSSPTNTTNYLIMLRGTPNILRETHNWQKHNQITRHVFIYCPAVMECLPAVGVFLVGIWVLTRVPQKLTSVRQSLERRIHALFIKLQEVSADINAGGAKHHSFTAVSHVHVKSAFSSVDSVRKRLCAEMLSACLLTCQNDITTSAVFLWALVPFFYGHSNTISYFRRSKTYFRNQCSSTLTRFRYPIQHRNERGADRKSGPRLMLARRISVLSLPSFSHTYLFHATSASKLLCFHSGEMSSTLTVCRTPHSNNATVLRKPQEI